MSFLKFDVILLLQCVLFGVTQGDEACSTNTCNIEYLSPDTLPMVILDYNDLHAKADLSSSIETAYGNTGLGILLVKNVPGVAEKRKNLLETSRQLAHLDEAIKQQLEDKVSSYAIGYSHGKEMLAKGQPDLRKISYYANPISNHVTDDEELVKNHRPVYGDNIWPDQHLPQLETAFMDMGQLIHSVGQLIAHQLDQYVMRVRDGYEPGLFQQVIGTDVPKGRLLYYLSDQEMDEYETGEHSDRTDVPKGRLLYYLSDQEMDEYETGEHSDRTDNWCGWHNDHSALTGLVLGMFFDENGNIVHDIAHYKDNKDAKGGLYIKTRENVTYSVELTETESESYLAFQIGETSQILSGGALVATPHGVMAYKSPKYYNISRVSFAVFHQPHYDLSMKAPYHEGITLEKVQFDRFLPDNVPALSSRWWNATGDTFGQFSSRTIQAYYG
eukprot:262757_1